MSISIRIIKRLDGVGEVYYTAERWRGFRFLGFWSIIFSVEDKRQPLICQSEADMREQLEKLFV